jgi:hypothetical protein
MISRRSGVVGSLVRSGATNSWAPPIPACIVNSMDRVVDSPGLMVVCPTTASGGQHPLTALTRGTPASLRVPLPLLVKLKATRAGA